MKKLSVLLYNHNTSEAATRSARSLGRLRKHPRCPVEVRVTVFDDGSDPSDRRALEALPGAVERQFLPTRRGLGSALNLHLETDPGDLLLLVRPRVKLEPDAILELLHRLEADPSLAAVSPSLLLEGAESFRSLPLFEPLADLSADRSFREADEELHRAAARRSGLELTNPASRDQEATLHPDCFLTHRKAWSEVGLWPTDLDRGFELLEWIHRATDRGLSCRCLGAATGLLAATGEGDADDASARTAWLDAARDYVSRRRGSMATSRPLPATEAAPNRTALGKSEAAPDLPGLSPGDLLLVDRSPLFLRPVIGTGDPASPVGSWWARAWNHLPGGEIFIDAIDRKTGAVRAAFSVTRTPAAPGDGSRPAPDRTGTAPPAVEKWEIDLYRPGDEEAICECFERTFDRKKPMAVWQWQFRRNPAGIRVFVARTPSGRVVAQFAGLPVRMNLDGEEHVFTQMVDNMVDPDYRQGLRRRGVFSEVVYRYVDHYGKPEVGETVGFGLPNPQAFRIGRRLLGYSHIQDVYETTRILTGEDASRPEEIPPETRIEVSEEPPADAGEFFESQRARYPLTIIRDVPFLKWRYTESPLATFHFVSARTAGGDLLGYAVLRIGYLEDPGTSAIVDWLSVEGNDEVDRAIARRCERIAIENGAGRIVSFFPVDRKEVALLQGLGYSADKSNWLLVGRTYHPEVKLEWVAKHWYYTLGEFDLV